MTAHAVSFNKGEMVTMKKTLLSACIVLGLSGCVSTEQSIDIVEISTQAYIANEAIDVAQAVVGYYSENQDALEALDAWQEKVKEGLKDGTAVLNAEVLHKEGVAIYTIFKEEAVAKSDSLDPAQLSLLTALDNTLISLDTKIKTFLAKDDSVGLVSSVVEVSEVLSTAKTVLSIYTTVQGI